MKKTLAILALIGAVVCSPGGSNGFGGKGGPGGRGGQGGGGRGGGGRGGKGGPDHSKLLPPYLGNVTEEARREYFTIVSNTNLAIAAQNEEILSWGEKYGVLDQVEEFNTNMVNLRNEVKQNVTELISQLPDAIEQFSKIMENEDQTRAQQREAIDALIMENPPLYQVLKFAVAQFMPKRGTKGQGRGKRPTESFEFPEAMNGRRN